jgi:hypothetical protein
LSQTLPRTWLRIVARRTRRLIRRSGIVVPAAGIAAALVVLVAIASYVISPSGDGAAGMETALSGLTRSQQIVTLEQERQEMAVMDAAAATFSMPAKPATVDPDSVIQADQEESDSSGNNVPEAAPPDPGSAEQIGYDMLPSFGFNQTTQWSCLDDLWTRESGWRYDAENPDGAYGIPQAYPGSKMASAGADWETDPTTQIKWGLGYITDTYGTPCGAWAEEEATGSY